jgi:hypothetical protein
MSLGLSKTIGVVQRGDLMTDIGRDKTDFPHDVSRSVRPSVRPFTGDRKTALGFPITEVRSTWKISAWCGDH